MSYEFIATTDAEIRDVEGKQVLCYRGECLIIPEEIDVASGDDVGFLFRLLSKSNHIAQQRLVDAFTAWCERDG